MSRSKQNQLRTTPQVQILNLARTEIPQPTLDLQRAKGRGSGQIDFGIANLFPQECAELFRESPTLRAVISSKADYFSGEDITYTGADYVNGKGDNHQNILRKVAMDYYLSGNAYLYVHKVGGNANLYHMDQVKVRKHAELDRFLISKNWAQYRRAGFEPYEMAKYPNFAPIEGKEGEFSMVSIQDYESGFDYYGLPEWLGAIYYAKLETLIGQFNVNMFDNGMFGSGILTINSENMTDEQVEDTVRNIKRDLVGTERGNTGKIIVLVGGKEATSSFEELTKEFDGSYIEMKGMCEDTIVSANSWKRSLAGLATEGTLGNNQQILNEYSVAMKDVRRKRGQLLTVIDALNAEFRWWGEYEIIDTPPINEADGALQGQQIQQLFNIVSDENLEDSQKRAMLSLAFGITEEEADGLLGSATGGGQ